LIPRSLAYIVANTASKKNLDHNLEVMGRLFKKYLNLWK